MWGSVVCGVQGGGGGGCFCLPLTGMVSWPEVKGILNWPSRMFQRTEIGILGTLGCGGSVKLKLPAFGPLVTNFIKLAL